MFLEHSPGQAELLLGNLSSLLHIPTRYDTSSPYRMYHRSLGEYLQETLPSRDVEEFRVNNCLRILANKGPPVPASYSEKVSFSEAFIHDWEMIKDAILRATKTDLAQAANNSFARCDLLWWIKVLLTSEPRLAVECVASSFAQFHQECDDNNAICIPACRHWRQSILTYCRSNGWTTPGEAVILKEREWNLRRDSAEAESTNQDDYRSDAELRKSVSDGAMHNSADRFNAPTCHPDTRKAVQEDIFGWMTHGGESEELQKILWLSGPAGCGKTAIAGSIAEGFHESGILAASFFFSSFAGSPKRRLKRFLIPTLAYQLMQSDRTGGVRRHILSSINEDPSVLKRRLKDQCRILLLEPFLNHPWPHFKPRVIVIDGLDEVESEFASRDASQKVNRFKLFHTSQADQIEILDALLFILTNKAFPFRLFIASRPERALREWFSSPLAKKFTHELFLDGKYHPDADIELFLCSKFSEIRRRYRLPVSWPSTEVVNKLVHNASGQSIYASTVIRFVEDEARTPPEQLDCILQMQPVGTDNPLQVLYSLYQRILELSPNPKLAALWIAYVTPSGNRIMGLDYFRPARYFQLLLETKLGQAEFLLVNLASFRDYLDSIVTEQELKEFGVAAYSRILSDKEPAVPVAFSEKRYFMRIFIVDWMKCFVTVFEVLWGTVHSPDINITLAQCDVQWWIRALVNTQPGLAARNISWAFTAAHHNCDYENNVCNTACSHWRQGILAFCRANGWTTPGESALLGERTFLLEDRRRSRRGDYLTTPVPIGFHFKPPGLSVAHLLSAAESDDRPFVPLRCGTPPGPNRERS
ncbi:hypothetical protein NMY22_g17590 [Coprinellus aureogranulatus]|nr:hypothetical protein NMY22_g17590 [Coprinellus aureogranulatus]